MNDFFKHIFKAKSERRKELINLPIEEKVRIIEKLKEMGEIMIKARNTLKK